MICGFLYNIFFCSNAGTTEDRDSDDGRPLSLVNSRIPTISAPMSARKSSSSRVHTPPQSSPAELLGDGASSTPKSLLVDGELSLLYFSITISSLDLIQF